MKKNEKIAIGIVFACILIIINFVGLIMIFNNINGTCQTVEKLYDDVEGLHNLNQKVVSLNNRLGNIEGNVSNINSKLITKTLTKEDIETILKDDENINKLVETYPKQYITNEYTIENVSQEQLNMAVEATLNKIFIHDLTFIAIGVGAGLLAMLGVVITFIDFFVNISGKVHRKKKEDGPN